VYCRDALPFFFGPLIQRELDEFAVAWDNPEYAVPGWLKFLMGYLRFCTNCPNYQVLY